MDKKSQHILNASSNLLGFTFLVLTSIKGFGLPQGGYVDEIVSFSVVCFASSAFFSFASIRSKTEKNTNGFETIADYLFLFALTILAVTSILFVFDFISFTK